MVQDAAVVERQFVDAVAVDHEGPLRPEPMDDLGEASRRRGTSPDAEHLAGRAGGVRQGTEQVERRADADLAARRAGVAHRGVEVRREQEREARVVQGGRGRRRVVIDPDPERVEHIGRARLRGDRPVAVLGDRHAGGRHDERCGRARC